MGGRVSGQGAQTQPSSLESAFSRRGCYKLMIPDVAHSLPLLARLFVPPALAVLALGSSQSGALSGWGAVSERVLVEFGHPIESPSELLH